MTDEPVTGQQQVPSAHTPPRPATAPPPPPPASGRRPDYEAAAFAPQIADLAEEETRRLRAQLAEAEQRHADLVRDVGRLAGELSDEGTGRAADLAHDLRRLTARDPRIANRESWEGPLPASLAADLFRRAAAALLEHVGRMPDPWAVEPWRVVRTDTESVDGLAVCTRPHDDDPTGAYDCCWSTEPLAHEAVAGYARLMQPTVGLTLARLLEAHATLLRADAASGASTTEVFGVSHLVELARALTGEPAS